jgi:hypothetical protein
MALVAPGKGRPKGSKNKRETIADILGRRGINPLDTLVKMLDTCEEESNRIKIALYLCDHIYGKPKPAEDPESHPIEEGKITIARKDLIAIARGDIDD